MAGDQLTEAPKGAPPPPGESNGEILLAQLGSQPKGRSLADQIVRGPTPAGDTKPKEPPPPGETNPGTPKPADAPVKPKDAPAATTDGKDVVLKLSWTDPKFDDTIWKTVKYNTLEITDFPKGAGIQHWKDSKGDYFWVDDGKGKELDGKRHYYPGNVAKLIVNGSKPQDLVAERKKVGEAIARKAGADVLDGVMTLNYADPDFDAKLWKTNVYDTIKIKGLKPDAKLTYQMDDKGFYFDVGDGKKHYYPNNAKQIAVDGKLTPDGKPAVEDLTKSRMASIEAFGNDKFGGFKSFERQRDAMSNMTQVQMFADGMSRKASGSLDVLDKNLTEAIKSSEHHPYFKYLLANVKLAQAMVAVRERVLEGKSVNHPSVVDKIDKCDELLDQVMKESDGRLRKLNRFPKHNAPLMPLAPWAAYDPRNPNGYYEFWGGTYDQAAFMKPGVKLIRGMVEANALGLPPVRP